MRTNDEIVARIKELETSKEDLFGFQTGDLLAFLPFDVAKPWLKDDASPEKWGDPAARDTESVKAKMLDYMPFAWGKANDCRGMSAGRSVEHMKAWLWMLGDDLGERLDDIYEFYGKPCLRAVCEKYGWDWRQWDDGVWRNSEDDEGFPAPALAA